MKKKINDRKICFFRGAIVTIMMLLISATFSCKKMIEIESPINSIVGKEIYNSNATAASVLSGIYADMSNFGIFTGANSISLLTGLSGDELETNANPSSVHSILYTNSLSREGDLLFWNSLYSYIFRTNGAIEGISQSKGITDQVRSQLLGEAKFLRAFMYFYLVNLYGDVPLLISTDVKLSSLASRTEKSEVYIQITKDLKDAQGLLSNNYLSGDAQTTSAERVRPNRSAATALLARVFLYSGNWVAAEEEASELINDSRFIIDNISDVFRKESKEAIWQLQPVVASKNTLDATIYVLSAGPNNSPPSGPDGGSRPVFVSKQLYNAFEINDKRREVWMDSVEVSGITYPFVYKYKQWLNVSTRTEYLVVFRLAEQYLIRAEARARQGRVIGSNSAEQDLNVVRNRAGLSGVSSLGVDQMLSAIVKEKRLELFTEFGHRWMEMKRAGTINSVMVATAVEKGGTWSNYMALFPIPLLEIERNPSLRGHQNPGYPER